MAVDYDTAVAIAKGESSPQVAFMQGSLKLGGDVMVLVERAGALEALGDALGSVRDRTEY
jgi:putative sterol carrier protein